jgi:hypothetical protein
MLRTFAIIRVSKESQRSQTGDSQGGPTMTANEWIRSNAVIPQQVTLEQAKHMIREMGGTPLNGASWEDDRFVYASSSETCGASTYGHPRYEVQFSKESGWLSRSGQKPVRLGGAL